MIFEVLRRLEKPLAQSLFEENLKLDIKQTFCHFIPRRGKISRRCKDDQEQETEEDCPTPTASSTRDGRRQRDNQDQDPEKSLPSMPAMHTRYGRAVKIPRRSLPHGVDAADTGGIFLLYNQDIVSQLYKVRVDQSLEMVVVALAILSGKIYKFSVKLKKSFTETLALMNEAYEDEKLSRTQNIADDSRSGRPLTSTMDRNIGQYGSCQKIIGEHLNMKKLCDQQGETRLSIFKDLIETANNDSDF
ncbi:hypothetical protein LAZ67_12001827 [Cordylochernes scorpioides]|uniref:Uncharacterized protein n=1 Tax=Cordylochernes scorpioides TaxID=51811 RepID=A0ABY6L5A0_9ARAC|nr:hypothetical protein LAZ67_12001827 [Cordylochernes scorpioides]